MKMKDRTYTRTGINWDNFFKDAGHYRLRKMPKILDKAVRSAASSRNYMVEAQEDGYDEMIYIFKRDHPVDRMLREFSKLQEKELKALYNAAIQAKIIEGGML
jgi:hypothetical protein